MNSPCLELPSSIYLCHIPFLFLSLPFFSLYSPTRPLSASVHGHLRTARLEGYKVLPQGCSPYAAMIYSCVNAETFLNCPTKMWKLDQPCQVAKQFAQQCNPLPHVPLPMS